MGQLYEYDTFKDLGKHFLLPVGYKNIQVHLVYDVKHDGHQKARLVADGHLTDIKVESVYSGFFSIRGILLLVFLLSSIKLKHGIQILETNILRQRNLRNFTS